MFGGCSSQAKHGLGLESACPQEEGYYLQVAFRHSDDATPYTYPACYVWAAEGLAGVQSSQRDGSAAQVVPHFCRDLGKVAIFGEHLHLELRCTQGTVPGA